MSFESGAGSSKKKIDKLKIAIVDTSDALEAQARDIAEERLTASKEELKGIKGIFSKIWKHNLAREYYRQKEIAKGKLEITESGNLYVGEGATQEIHTQAMHAVINRFVEEYEEVIHTDVGETRRKVGVENAQDVELNRSVRELVRAYAANELDDEAFNAERSRVIAYATGLTGTERAQAVNHTDNILEVARQARSAVEQGARIDVIDQEIEIVIGKAKTGVRTEAQFNTVDRIAKKMQSTWVGKFVNETSIASGVAIAYATTIGLSQRLASSKAFAWGTFGASALVGGAVAAMRESVQVEEERKQHARQRAKGVEIAPDSERRTEMESLIYASVPAQSLTETLSNIPEVIDSPEVFMSLMNTLAEAEMRIRLSDREKIDLLSYTDFKSVEAERLSLDIARAKAKVALTTMAASHADFLPPEQTFAQFYDSLLDTKSAMLRGGDEGMEAKDKLFKKMKRRKVAGAAAKAVLTGLTIGAVAEEGVAFMLDSREGVLEHALGAQGPHRAEGVTVFEGLRRFMDEGASLGRVVENSILPNGAHVALPEGVQIIPNPLNVNEATFVKDGEVFSQKIIFENGVLTKASEDFLATHEISVTKNIVQLSGETPASVDPRTFADSHPELFNKIQRKFWYDNNTTLFDKNELKLHWGGVKGTGVDQSGNYVFNIGKMTGDGSIHGSTSIDAPGVMKQQPGLKLLLSLSKETQSSVVEVPIDAQGNAVIDPQSTIGKMFFKNEGGKLTFIGKFAEIAHEAGVSKSGAKQFEILATHTGAGVDSVPTGNTIDPYTVSRFGVTDTEPFIDPMFVPLFGRTPLEEMRVRKNEEYHTKSKNGKDEFVVPMPYYYAGSGFEYSAEQANLHEQDRSPRLKENPDVTLDESLEINEYLERQEVDYKKYLKEVAAEFGPITNTCRVSVCIPVADHQEGGNIYNSLKNYTNQSADPETFELVLFTNHPETDKKGKPIAPDNTLEEIARFKKDFPRMNVRVCSRVIPVENAKIGYIRKVMNDAVLMRQKNRTKGSPELIMISNDADNKGIATEYIENFIYQFDRNPDVDSFVGQLDWDLEAYVKNPLIHVGTRMILYLSAQSRSNGWHFESSGANTAFKASIYAAVGGYDTNLKGGEDSDLGARIASARVRAQKKESIGYAGTRVSRLFTSARRAEMVMEKYGMSPREQWDKGFSAFDDDVRKVNWQNKGLVNFDNPNEVAELVKGIEDVINRTIKRGNQWGKPCSIQW